MAHENQRNEVIKVTNVCDGRTYRASIAWQRKAILVEEESIFPGATDIEQHLIFAEALIWTGGWLALTFQPTLIISYTPAEPTDPHPEIFLELTRKVLTECDLKAVVRGDAEEQLENLCAPYRVSPIFGQRRHPLTLSRVPHLLLFGGATERIF